MLFQTVGGFGPMPFLEKHSVDLVLNKFCFLFLLLEEIIYFGKVNLIFDNKSLNNMTQIQKAQRKTESTG